MRPTQGASPHGFLWSKFWGGLDHTQGSPQAGDRSHPASHIKHNSQDDREARCRLTLKGCRGTPGRDSTPWDPWRAPRERQGPQPLPCSGDSVQSSGQLYWDVINMKLYVSLRGTVWWFDTYRLRKESFYPHIIIISLLWWEHRSSAFTELASSWHRTVNCSHHHCSFLKICIFRTGTPGRSGVS